MKYLLTALFISSLLYFCSNSKEQTQQKPNILFIAIDDLRPELGCYGDEYIKSPNIDKFAKDGFLFTRHYVNIPTCGASRQCLLTGQLPISKAYLGNDITAKTLSVQPEKDVPETFIHQLKRNGYYTVGIGKITHHPDGYVYGYLEPKSNQLELPYSWDEMLLDDKKWGSGHNAFFGYASGHKNINGNSNTFIGNSSGNSNTAGSGNVFIGYESGFYETGSNKLYISNNSSSTPLIYGDFQNRQLKINGTLEFTTAFATSDRRWKKDIKPLDNSLEKVQQLDGKSYLWRRDEFPDKGFSKQRQIGLIAQEVEKIIPEIVQSDENGFKSISYTQLIPLLIEAVKSQQTIIAEHEQSLQEQKNQTNALKNRLDALSKR